MRQHLLNEVYSAVLLYVANRTVNLLCAISEAKTESSLHLSCPHVYVVHGSSRKCQTWNFWPVWHTSMTSCCLCYLAWLCVLPGQSRLPCSVPTWLETVQKGVSVLTFLTKQPKLWVGDCITLLLCLRSCLSSQPPAVWSHSSNLSIQWKTPDKPQGYAPCTGFLTDSQRVSWQSVTPTVLYHWWSYSREAIRTS